MYDGVSMDSRFKHKTKKVTMSFFDLGSPVDSYPANHPINGVTGYAEWVKATRIDTIQTTGEVATADATSTSNAEITTTKHGREVVEQAFIVAGLCDAQYLRDHAA